MNLVTVMRLFQICVRIYSREYDIFILANNGEDIRIHRLFGFEIINNYQFSALVHFVHLFELSDKKLRHQMLTIKVRSSKFVLLRMKWVYVYAAKKLKSSPPTEEIRELANFLFGEIVGESWKRTIAINVRIRRKIFKSLRIKLTLSRSLFPFDWCNLCLLRTFY